MAAGSVVITEKNFPSVKLITFAWTSDASGVVSGLATTTNRYSGQAIELATVPGASVSSYVISILDSNSLDIVCGAGTGRSTTLTEYLKQASLGGVSDDVLTLSITGAGNAKTGTAYLLIR